MNEHSYRRKNKPHENTIKYVNELAVNANTYIYTYAHNILSNT